MAAYPIYQPQFGIYNPNNFSKQPTTGDALTVDTAKLYFLQFPNAQTSQTEYLHSIGVGSDATFNGPVVFNETVTYNQDIEFLANVIVDGTATVTGNLLCDTTATVSGILTCETGIDISVSGGLTFPDNTTQTTAFIEANYAQLNTDNAFLAGFTQTFNGPVNLNDATNGVTQLNGDNSTLLATTEFVQNAVQVSGVQVTDSPLLWSGANTNQYNAGTGLTLPYSYPYGLSQLYNLSGGNEEFSLVANNGVAGASDNAFRIYCTQGNQTGALLQGTTPQLILSNNNTAMFVRDGINVNTKTISNIGTLSGTSPATSINFDSPISTNSGKGVYINDAYLYLYNGSENSQFEYSSAANQLTIFNNSYHTDNTANIAFNLNNSSGGQAPVNILQIYPNEVDVRAPLNLNNNSLTGVNVINPNTNGSTISFQDYSANILTLNYLGINAYENLTMNAANINMNTNNISGIGILTGTGIGDITINSGLNFSTGGGINMGLGSIINCNSITDTSGQYTTTNTPPDNSITTAIATTGYVATAISNIPSIDLSNYAQLTTTNAQTFTGYINFNNQVFALTQASNTNNTTIATTAFVKANAGIYTQTSITPANSVYYSLSPSTVNVISTYTSANNVVSFNSVQFNIVIGTVPTFLLAQLYFSASPFPGAPPATTQTISMYCSNGATYSGTITWLSATQIYIGPPSGIILSSGMTFTVNLASLGAFTP